MSIADKVRKLSRKAKIGIAATVAVPVLFFAGYAGYKYSEGMKMVKQLGILFGDTSSFDELIEGVLDTKVSYVAEKDTNIYSNGVKIKTKDGERIFYWKEDNKDLLLKDYKKGDIIKLGFVKGEMVSQEFIPRTKKNLETYKSNYKKIFNKEVDKNTLYDSRDLPSTIRTCLGPL